MTFKALLTTKTEGVILGLELSQEFLTTCHRASAAVDIAVRGR